MALVLKSLGTAGVFWIITIAGAAQAQFGFGDSGGIRMGGVQAQDHGPSKVPKPELMNLKPKQVVGRIIVNSEGQDLGDIEKLVQDEQGNIAAVVGEGGGFLGIGEKEILVDLNQLTFTNDKLVMDAQGIRNQPQYQYDADRYQEVTDSDKTIGQLIQSGSGMRAGEDMSESQ